MYSSSSSSSSSSSFSPSSSSSSPASSSSVSIPPARALKRQLHLTTYNRFDVLCDLNHENEDRSIIGDSIVRDQLTEFCSRVPGRHKRLCSWRNPGRHN
ncbi:hypothetical protein E2C01_092426 [Portunus trituberculatus]|uniref:Uncharacterized protein n=1 Tax=Portunus trituberculatus TaxID=210409 RepID=A0A5B7JLY0_PORTR|nr:hypothetical protein [Portunus trituberculatus]